MPSSIISFTLCHHLGLFPFVSNICFKTLMPGHELVHETDRYINHFKLTPFHDEEMQIFVFQRRVWSVEIKMVNCFTNCSIVYRSDENKKNHYFLTQTRKSNSYLLVTVLRYYRLKHINSRRNLESDMQMKQNRRILPRNFFRSYQIKTVVIISS